MQLKSHMPETAIGATVFNPDGSVAKVYSNLKKKKKRQVESNIEFKVLNKSGDVVQAKKIPFRSFTENFTLWLQGDMGRVSYSSTNGTTGIPGIAQRMDHNGTLRNYYNQSNYHPQMVATVGQLRGIVLGTANTAITPQDFSMATVCGEGTGVNQFNYQEVVHNAIVADGGGYRYTIQRLVTNNSAAPIVVQEAGLYATRNSYTFLFARDVEDKNSAAINVSVGIGQTLSISYNIYIDGSDGLLNNWLHFLRAAFSGNSSTDTDSSIRQTGASAGISGNDYDWLSVREDYGSIVNATDKGMFVGKGLAAESVDDYVMSSRLDPGAGLDLLDHNLTMVQPITTVVNVTEFVISRHFTNNHIADQDITEVGLCAHASGENVMITRNLLASVITLTPGQAVQLTFTFRTTI